MLTIFLSNKNIKILEGSAARGQLCVDRCISLPDTEGTVINGAIANEAALESLLREAFSTYQLSQKQVNLLVDSGQISFRTVLAPQQSRGKTLDFISREFSGLDRMEDPVFGYFLLQKEKNRTCQLFAMAAASEYIRQYTGFFQKLGVTLTGIENVNGALTRLIQTLPQLQEKNAIVQIVDSASLTSVLVCKGNCETFNRRRLMSEEGSPAYAVEILRAVNNLQQFVKAQHLEDVTHVYLAGVSKEVFDLYADGIYRRGDLEPDRLDLHSIRGKDIAREDLEGYIMALGGLLPPRQSCNLLAYSRYTGKMAEFRRNLLPVLVPAVAVLALFTAACLFLLHRNDQKEAELKKIQAFNEDQTVTSACDQYDQLEADQTLIVKYYKQLEALDEAVSDYPRMGQAVADCVAEASQGLVETRILDYSAKTGTMNLETTAEDANQISDFVDRLEKTKLFYSVEYPGYIQSQKDGLWTTTVKCTMGAWEEEE